MPNRLPVPCLEPGCPALTRTGSRCPAHQVSGWSSSASASEGGYGAEWQRIRRIVLEQEPNCRRCGDRATDVDHIIPRSAGGTDAPSNLQPLCSGCHRTKSSAEGGRARSKGQGGGEGSRRPGTPPLGLPLSRSRDPRETGGRASDAVQAFSGLQTLDFARETR
jgi:5-methylcytosine-specific restriction enzyme A